MLPHLGNPFLFSQVSREISIGLTRKSEIGWLKVAELASRILGHRILAKWDWKGSLEVASSPLPCLKQDQPYLKGGGGGFSPCSCLLPVELHPPIDSC